MIALMILATLALHTANSIRTSATDKVKMQNIIDRNSKFRSVINVIERDINTVFNYRDINIEIYKKVQETYVQNKNSSTKNAGKAKKSQITDLDNPSNNEDALIDLSQYDEKKSHTQFIGDKEEIHFVNSNHIRTQATAQESSLQEVSYYLKNCRNRLDPKLSYPCLFRRTDPYVDDDIKEGGKAIVLLENVKKFELKYYNLRDDEWLSLWDNSEKGKDYMKFKVPTLIEVSLSFEDEGKTLEARRVFPIRFTNNDSYFESKKTKNDPANAASQSTDSTQTQEDNN